MSCEKESDIGRAFLLMWLRRSVLRGLKRAAFDRDVEALRLGPRPAITVQSYIRGPLANIAIACWRGEVVAQVAVEVVRSNGPFGMATAVRVVDGDAMVATARSIARHYDLSGLYGLDFVIDAKSGAPYLIEINWRATQVGHLPLGEGRDLPAALLLGLRRRGGSRAGRRSPPARLRSFPRNGAAIRTART